MGSKAVLEWSYIPSDLIDGVLEFEKYGGRMVAQDGRAKAEFDERDYRADSDLAGKFLQNLKARIAPIERRKHQAAEFSTLPTLTVTHPDGGCEVYLEYPASLLENSNGVIPPNAVCGLFSQAAAFSLSAKTYSA
jgi:hypothetical protein